jgi:hypothetical protein
MRTFARALAIELSELRSSMACRGNRSDFPAGLRMMQLPRGWRRPVNRFD